VDIGVFLRLLLVAGEAAGTPGSAGMPVIRALSEASWRRMLVGWEKFRRNSYKSANADQKLCLMGAGLCLEPSHEFEGLQATRGHHAVPEVGREGRGRQQFSCLAGVELGLLFCPLSCTYRFLVPSVARSSVKSDGSFADELPCLSGKRFLYVRVPDLFS